MDPQRIKNLTLKDPLSFGITYIDLLEDKQWEVDSRLWSVEPYHQVNPFYIEREPGHVRKLVIRKSTQSGISTLALTKMFHFACHWPVRVFYTLPRQQDVHDMVGTRVDPMIRNSPKLKELLGNPDSTHAKKIGDSYVFFMELSVEPRMMPADAIFVDEVDLSDPTFMSTAVNRMDASRWKLSYYLSTPTLPYYGIDALYNVSDKRQWMVKCPKCGHRQSLDWEVNLRVQGPRTDPTKVFYGCEKCSAELTIEHIQTGEWVPEKPSRSDESVGYHVHQLLTTPAPELYKSFMDPQTTLVEFYRKRLGKPYEVGSGSLSRDDFLINCFDDPYEAEHGWAGDDNIYYLGADQGNEIQVTIAKVETNSRRKKIVHVELIPIEKGFNRVAQLMRLYRVRRAVIDGNPNRHEVTKLTTEFPGRVLIADYIEQKETFRAKKGQKKSYLTNISINRTTAFDALVDGIRSGEWALPGTPPHLSSDIELLIDHLLAIKRDTEIRKKPSGSVEVGVWRALRADHLAHAMSYLNAAIELNRSRRTGRIAVISSGAEEEEEDTEEKYRPDPEVIASLTSRLSEVPAEQIEWYLNHRPGADEDIPFPLSYKLEVIASFEETDILWVLQQLLSDKSGG